MFSLFLAQVIFDEIDAKFGQIVCLIVPYKINKTGVYESEKLELEVGPPFDYRDIVIEKSIRFLCSF